MAEPSIEEARQVFAVRRMVEGQMVRELIQRLKPAHLRQLKAHLKEEHEAVTRIDVATRTKEAGGSLGDLVRAVATTDAFRKRRGEGG